MEYTFSDGIYIDGSFYDVPILSCDIKPDALWKYAERTEDGVHNGEMLGVYYNYTIKCGSIVDQNEYKRLIYKLTEPVEYHTVKLPDWNGDMVDMTMYFAVDSLGVKSSYDGVTCFKGLAFQCITRYPTRT